MTIYIIDSQYDGVMCDKYFTKKEYAEKYLTDNALERFYYVTEMEVAY